MNTVSRRISRLLVFACSTAWVSRSQCASHDDVPREFVTHEEILAYERTKYPIEIAEFVRRLEPAPTYMKLVFAEELANRLLIDKECPMSELAGHRYAYREGTHDLRRLPGRAAHALEHLLGVALPKVTPASSPADLKLLHGKAVRLLGAYRSGVMAMVRDYEIGKRADALTATYKGKVRPGARHWYESTLAMARLLADWFPIGKKLSDLEKIVGYKPDRRDRKQVSYWFETSTGGWAFHFTIEDGIITSVSIRGIE